MNNLNKMNNPFFLTDGYKTSHKFMYPDNVTKVYSNMTARSNTYSDSPYVINFGLQYALDQIVKAFDEGFFSRDKEEVVAEISYVYTAYLGMPYDTSHISALHDLGYLPIKVKTLPEGAKVNHKVPLMTIVNTHADFAWVTNFLETTLSTLWWKGIVNATTAHKYRLILHKYAQLTTDGDASVIDYQAHDFSMRGLDSMYATEMTGMAHALSFNGSDSLPTIIAAIVGYHAKNVVVNSVPATEHSVMCAGGKAEEKETFLRLMREFPVGILSVVSDTWDLWKVLTETLPSIREEITKRDGKLVIRPDCYDSETSIFTEHGWKLFKDLTNNDLVAQVNDDGSYTFVRPLKIVNQEYKGEMISYKDHFGKVDLLVTPNHRMVFSSKTKGTIIREAGKFKGTANEYRLFRSANARSSDKRLTWEERLAIAFQADGSYVTKSDTKIRFTFNKERKITRLYDILNAADIQSVTYELSDGRREIHVEVDASKYHKDFSWVDISNLSVEWCQEFIEELSYWDATRRSEGRFKFDTTIKIVSDVVEIIAISAGYGCLTSEREDNREDHFSNVYTSHILKFNMIGGQAVQYTKTQYDGTVHCVTVPSGKLLVKRNRSILVSGNSGDPINIICGKDRFEPLYDSKDSDDLTLDFDKFIKLVEEHILENVREDTPHGECGADEDYAYLSYRGKYYYAEVSGICWNRYDKQYYFMDNYGNLKVTVEELQLEPEDKGVIELLWDTFGGTINSKGYKELDPHIGAIYGDSITLDRAEQICNRLEKKGFASTNIVYGIGSYTYTYNTRDTEGWRYACPAIA